MKNIIFAFILSFSGLISNAQESFYKTYPFYNFTEKIMVFAWEDGYTIAVVAAKDTFCLSIIRTNLEGDTLWTKDYDIGFFSTNANLRGTSDGEGNIYLSLTQTNKNLLKIDQNGIIVWFKDYPFLQHIIKYGNDFLWAITNTGGKSLYKINPNTGDTLWKSQPFGSEGFNTSMAIKQNGDITVTTNHYTGNMSFVRVNTLPVDSSEFGSVVLPGAHNVVISDTKYIGDELISVGYQPSINNTPYDNNHFYRYLPDGTIHSSKIMELGCLASYTVSFVINQNNQLVALGYCLDGWYSEAVLQCLTLDFDKLWTKRFENIYWYQNIELCEDGGYIISLVTNGPDGVQPCLIKTNIEGNYVSNSAVNANSTISVYPNPANEMVYFDGNNLLQGTITIYDVLGKSIITIEMNGGKATWETSTIKKGVYIYHFISSKGIKTGKILIN